MSGATRPMTFDELVAEIIKRGNRIAELEAKLKGRDFTIELFQKGKETPQAENATLKRGRVSDELLESLVSFADNQDYWPENIDTLKEAEDMLAERKEQHSDD